MLKLRAALSFAFVLTLALAAAASAAETAAAPALQRVEAKKVCMVNNQVFERDMIPVEFEGKTYFGCCEMCKKTLVEKADQRTAIDPVSGKSVDKATAVIGARPDLTVLYFENEKNFQEYSKKKG